MKNETIVRQEPKFKIGDKVDFTNDYGVKFPNLTITGIDYWEGYAEPRYFFEPSGNPAHYASKEVNFKLTPIVKDSPLKGTW